MGRSLILGGAGFIGGNLARKLIEAGEEVRIFTRPSSSISNIDDILENVDIVYGDFSDDVALRNALTNIDVVYHLISTTFPSMTVASSVFDVLSNLLPTIRLVELCLTNGIKKIVYASSGGTVYGEPKITPIPETHPLMPTSAYGQSKLTIENYLNFYARTSDIDISILRISNPFGPGQKLFGVQGIIAVTMGCILYDRVLNIYDEGRAIRDYIYIDDVIQALLTAGNSQESAIVNISSAQGHSVMDIVHALETISGKEIRKKYVAARPGDVSVNILSNQYAFELYGWQPKISFEEGLAMTWNKVKQMKA